MAAIRPLTPEKYYRLPWNLADNAITWLEPTTECNMYCDGCYRETKTEGHRPLAEVIADLDALKAMRRSDGISIAGGEPLLYPEIVPLVRHVAGQGWKPVIITNGTALSPELVRELTEAGLVGFTVHVDSHQSRPGYEGKGEEELCELRGEYAQMISDGSGGRVSVGMNATIYPDTLKDIPYLTRWAEEHMDIVQTMVYILFRLAKFDPNFSYLARERKLDPDQLKALLRYNVDTSGSHQDVMVQEVVDGIRESSSEYEPCGFLNSHLQGETVKWLLSMRIGVPGRILGYMDSKFAEMVQCLHHLFFGTYLAYTRPGNMKNQQLTFPLAAVNRGLRRPLARWLGSPSLWFRSIRMQSLMIIQPPDLLADGRQSMCDGCPDAVYHNGRLLWKCRLEEVEKLGDFIQCVPRSQ